MQNQITGEQIDNEILLLGGITDRKLGLLRLILAAAALLIIYIDPTDPNRYIALTYSSITGFTVYSLFIYLAARRRTNFPTPVMNRLIWIDIAWVTALISMSSGSSSVFYFFYMFEIIVACSRGGRKPGLLVTAASSILCVSVGLIAPTSSDFELNRFLLRPLAIIALGYTLAYWGGTELALKKKLILLKELSKVANPRFGVDRTIEQMLRRLLDFYNADHCVLLLDQFIGSQFYHATHHSVLTGSLSSDAEVEIRKFLEQESNSCPGVFKNPDISGKPRATYTRCDVKSNRLLSSDPAPAKSLAGHLKANSMIAVTCQYREQYCGRLLVSSARTNAFEIVDAGFLLQIANQIFHSSRISVWLIVLRWMHRKQNGKELREASTTG